MEPPSRTSHIHTAYCPHVSLPEGRQAYPLQSAVGSGPPCTHTHWNPGPTLHVPGSDLLGQLYGQGPRLKGSHSAPGSPHSLLHASHPEPKLGRSSQ